MPADTGNISLAFSPSPLVSQAFSAGNEAMFMLNCYKSGCTVHQLGQEKAKCMLLVITGIYRGCFKDSNVFRCINMSIRGVI